MIIQQRLQVHKRKTPDDKPRTELHARGPRDAEHALLAAAWADPSTLSKTAGTLVLHAEDFRDRLCGVVVGYLRDCGESGQSPALAGAEAMLHEFAVPHDPDDLFYLLIDAPAPGGDSLADLIRDVLREADDRAEQLIRELTRDVWRAMVRGLRCPHCRTKRVAKRPSMSDKAHGRRVMYA